MEIRKAKLPKRMSYPLRSSALQMALADANITTKTVLLIGPGHLFFDAFFWPRNPRADHERFYIRSGAVPAADGAKAREYMASQVLPDFIAWALRILALPLNAPDRQAQANFFRNFSPDH